MNLTKSSRRMEKGVARAPASKTQHDAVSSRCIVAASPSVPTLLTSSESSTERNDQTRRDHQRRDLLHLRTLLATLNEERMSYVRRFFGVYHLQVLDQIIKPNYEAWVHALADQAWDEKTNDAKVGPVIIEVRFEHMAAALEMDLKAFEKCVSVLRTGFVSYINTGVVREHLDPDISRRLTTFFGLEPIPRALDVTIIRRFLALVAFHHRRKVTAEVAAMLKAVGVEPPQKGPARRKLSAPCTPKKALSGT